jgi:hypothetical protein
MYGKSSEMTFDVINIVGRQAPDLYPGETLSNLSGGANLPAKLIVILFSLCTDVGFYFSKGHGRFLRHPA